MYIRNIKPGISLAAIIILLIINIKYANCFKNEKNLKDINSLCNLKSCKNSTIQSLDVLDFCIENKAVINNRCCFNKTLNTSYLIGLDYSNCTLETLKNVTNNIRSVNNNSNIIESIKIFDIRNNLLNECDDEDYENFINLENLYLPSNCTCPGLNDSWSSITADSCIGQKDICLSNYTNVNCTKRSKCLKNGPGNFLCLCKENYHGYKCLEYGEFPTLTFTLTFSLSTLFFCGLLFHTQRRHVLKSSELKSENEEEEVDASVREEENNEGNINNGEEEDLIENID